MRQELSEVFKGRGETAGHPLDELGLEVQEEMGVNFTPELFGYPSLCKRRPLKMSMSALNSSPSLACP